MVEFVIEYAGRIRRVDFGAAKKSREAVEHIFDYRLETAIKTD